MKHLNVILKFIDGFQIPFTHITILCLTEFEALELRTQKSNTSVN